MSEHQPSTCQRRIISKVINYVSDGISTDETADSSGPKWITASLSGRISVVQHGSTRRQSADDADKSRSFFFLFVSDAVRMKIKSGDPKTIGPIRLQLKRSVTRFFLSLRFCSPNDQIRSINTFPSQWNRPERLLSAPAAGIRCGYPHPLFPYFLLDWFPAASATCDEIQLEKASRGTWTPRNRRALNKKKRST